MPPPPVCLAIFHYHFRPGGVRRVIELLAPEIVRASRGRIAEVLLAGGEEPPRAWFRTFRDTLGTVAAGWFADPSLGYDPGGEPTSRLADSVAAALDRIAGRIGPLDGAVWAHNLGLGRNLLLADRLAPWCARTGYRLLSHHHDWWFDARWERWPEFRARGARSLAAAARAILPASPRTLHLAINSPDADAIGRGFPGGARFCPDPAPAPVRPARQPGESARRWLRSIAGEPDAPLWLAPCRLLRRKNLAEAILLARWLRPGAWLVSTGGTGSSEEPYAAALRDAARRGRWKVALGALERAGRHAPPVEEVFALAEAVLQTSIQEGFGFAPVEAAAFRKPLILRRIPGVTEDLLRLGFRFPHSYDETLVAPPLYGWKQERARQEKRFREWLARIPAPVRRTLSPPPILLDARPRPIPFSRLTIRAQLEILAHPPGDSWGECASLNPDLPGWRERAGRGGLLPSTGLSAAKKISPASCGRRIWDLFGEADKTGAPDASASGAAQNALLASRCSGAPWFPLLSDAGSGGTFPAPWPHPDE